MLSKHLMDKLRRERLMDKGCILGKVTPPRLSRTGGKDHANMGPALCHNPKTNVILVKYKFRTNSN